MEDKDLEMYGSGTGTDHSGDETKSVSLSLEEVTEILAEIRFR